MLVVALVASDVLSRPSPNASFKAGGALRVGALILRYRNRVGFLVCVIVGLAVFDHNHGLPLIDS
jgi:hypothetical protein